MKKVFLLSMVSFAFFPFAFAQGVAINNDGSSPDASAMLDVKHPNKGLLIPRVALTSTADVSTIISPATSLLVYNTATNGSGAAAITPGFYYWSGAAWLRIGTGSGSATSCSLREMGGQ